MTLLCATHFSEAAQRAATAAAELARKMDEPLFLVHVLPADLSRAFGQPLVDTARAALTDEVRRLEKLGARVSHQLLTGEAATELARFAEEKGANLVVTAAATSASPFLGLGGTVDRLGSVLSVPLLVVRDTAPFEAWVKGERPLKVMLGVERSQPFLAARDWVKGLRRYGPVELVAARVYWANEEYERFGLPHSMTYQEVTPDLTRALEQEVRSLVTPLDVEGQPVRVRLEPGLGRIADHLVAIAADEKVDLLVVGTHHRRALGKLWSVSHHTLRLAKMSAVCVPVAAGVSEVPVPTLRSVLVATDFSDAGNQAVPYAFSMLPKGGTVLVVHVVEKGALVDPSREQEVRQRLQQVLPKDAETHGRKVELLVLSDENAAQAILQAADRLSVDALCVGTYGASGLKKALMGSVTQEVMARTDRPVLVVRPPRG